MPLYPGVTCSGRAIRFVCFHSPSVDLRRTFPPPPFLLPFTLTPVYSSIPSTTAVLLQSTSRDGYGVDTVHTYISSGLRISCCRPFRSDRVRGLYYDSSGACVYASSKPVFQGDGRPAVCSFVWITSLLARKLHLLHMWCYSTYVCLPLYPYLSTCMHRSPSS